MNKMIIKAYETEIHNEWYEDGATVLIGVVEEGHPDEAYFDSSADERIYFYITAEELENLKAGDVLNDGEDFTIIGIDKENPHIWEVEYNPKEFSEQI
jgi:hypothetical protein